MLKSDSERDVELRIDSGTTPTSYQYTGQRNDTAIGLYFDNARRRRRVRPLLRRRRRRRFALGRFIQADTIVPSPANPQSLNRYAYTLNNPLRYTDPTGHAHHNPEDPSYSTHPKACYNYTYPQAETQPTPASTPIATPTSMSTPTSTPIPNSTPMDPFTWSPMPNQDPTVSCRWVRGLRRTPENLNWYGLGTDLLGIAGDIGVFIPEVGGVLWLATEVLEFGSAVQDAAEMIGYIREGKILEPQTLYSGGRMFMDIFSLAPLGGTVWNIVDGMVELTVNGFEGVDIYVCDRGKK